MFHKDPTKTFFPKTYPKNTIDRFKEIFETKFLGMFAEERLYEGFTNISKFNFKLAMFCEIFQKSLNLNFIFKKFSKIIPKPFLCHVCLK